MIDLSKTTVAKIAELHSRTDLVIKELETMIIDSSRLELNDENLEYLRSSMKNIAKILAM